ncbi:MAG: amino acid ABC transporter substrate-binding protein [Leptolyngbyaceae cyanobacterium bins.59]|nr:amino acid ABC transporter substrate-binding protein [Leptolyngbyaceae cyanobacterium bins.59]
MPFWSIRLLATLLLGSLVACGGQTSAPPNSAATTSTGQSASPAQGQSRLDTILSRGKLICGVSGELSGFSFVNQEGKYSGLDVDICRAVAAALFDNPDAVEYRNLNAKERFTALQTGAIDLLSRNTTWTLNRDTAVRLEFAPVVFYDSQGLMVRSNGAVKSIQDLKGKTICTQTGTTNEQNISDQMQKRNLPYKPVVFEDVNATFTAYAEGRCDAVTSDRSQLASRRIALPKPEDHLILDEVLSKEPLAPAVATGDPRWADTVRWVVYTLINAEELGITTQSLPQALNSPDPVVKRFLGTEGNLGKDMGLPNDFAARVIKHVGNYGEVYDRNLGPKTRLNLPRGLNNLWNQDGLLYSPPFR